ncbi:unnamed protein product [Coccothraustes coccothraustes]
MAATGRGEMAALAGSGAARAQSIGAQAAGSAGAAAAGAARGPRCARQMHKLMSQQTAREDSGSGSAAERVGVKMRVALLPVPSGLFADGNSSREDSMHGRKAGGTSSGRADLQKVNDSKAATPGGHREDLPTSSTM